MSVGHFIYDVVAATGEAPIPAVEARQVELVAARAALRSATVNDSSVRFGVDTVPDKVRQLEQPPGLQGDEKVKTPSDHLCVCANFSLL